MSAFVTATYIVLWILVVVQFFAILAMYHHFGEMYLGTPDGREAQGPKVDARLRPLATADLDGNHVLLPLHSNPALLLFTSTKCPLCEKLLPELNDFANAHGDTRLMVICAGDERSVREWSSGVTKPVHVIADRGQQISRQYDVGSIPFCVGIDETGTVRVAGLLNTRRGLEEAIEIVHMRGRRSEDTDRLHNALAFTEL